MDSYSNISTMVYLLHGNILKNGIGFFRRYISMKAGDCFRMGKNVVLRYCRTTNVGLHMFAAIDVNTKDIYGKMLNDESLKHLKHLSSKVYNRIVKQL